MVCCHICTQIAWRQRSWQQAVGRQLACQVECNEQPQIPVSLAGLISCTHAALSSDPQRPTLAVVVVLLCCAFWHYCSWHLTGRNQARGQVDVVSMTLPEATELTECQVWLPTGGGNTRQLSASLQHMMTPQPEACGTANCRLLLLQAHLHKQPDRLTAQGVVSSDQHELHVSHDMSE
jgi:hypothetical protein